MRAISPPRTKLSPLELALAAAASATVRLDSGTQRIAALESPLVRARELADQHADSAFGSLLARAAERIEPVADHTTPAQVPATSMPRLTMLGVARIAQPVQRARVSMPALTDVAVRGAAATGPTELMRRPVAQGWWQQFTSVFRGWYKRWAWARRRRAALRS